MHYEVDFILCNIKKTIYYKKILFAMDFFIFEKNEIIYNTL